jgi:hypothetical protein
MPFSPIEKSRHEGEPVTLFNFIYEGDAADAPASLTTFSYTDAEQQIAFGGITYEPVPISRGKIGASGSLDKSALTIRLPRDIPLADLFIVYPPAQVVQLVIRQGHLSDTDPGPPEFLVVWSGRVLSVGRETDECVVTAEPISSSLRRSGLRRSFSIGCPHALFIKHVDSGGCGASIAAATETATVDLIVQTTITLAAGWEGARDPQKFVEGMVKWTDSVGGIQARKILSVNGNELWLSGFLRDLSVSDTVSVILGCNHLEDDCQNLHNVINDFGGFTWLPNGNNPVSTRNIFY